MEREPCLVNAHTDEEPQLLWTTPGLLGLSSPKVQLCTLSELYLCKIKSFWKAHLYVKLAEEWAQVLAFIFSLL